MCRDRGKRALRTTPVTPTDPRLPIPDPPLALQTPRPPPKPVAAFLSPVLWAMERPDRFDMYSCGVCMVQMLFAHLRNDNALIAFNKRLQVGACAWGGWRRVVEGVRRSGQRGRGRAGASRYRCGGEGKERTRGGR